MYAPLLVQSWFRLNQIIIFTIQEFYSRRVVKSIALFMFFCSI
jgi:hypothetical protein